MLIAYLDEFGHVGPYVADGHAKYGQHPAFGYAGFILPASSVRKMGAEFVRAKATLFKTEMQKSAAPAQWERKGSEYFTTGSIEKRPEQIRVFRGLIQRLRALDGHAFYYGDEKPRGTLKETGRSAQTLMEETLRQSINRICRHAESLNSDVLIIADSFTDKSRQELAAKMYGHIYSRPAVEMKRAVEAPLHIESKLNSSIQFADWICALMTRASHFQLVDNSQFAWASQHFQQVMQGAFTYESKLHLLSGNDIHHSELFKPDSIRFASRPGTIGAQIPNYRAIYEAALRGPRTPSDAI